MKRGGVMVNFKYWFKVIIISMIIILVAIMILSITLIYFINPDKYKPLITKAVYNAFQINLEINGTINWKILPKIQLEVHNINVKNPKLFITDKNFLHVNTLYVALNLKSLLKNKFSINEFRIDGAELNLIKDRHFKNWQEFFKYSNKKNDNSFQFSINKIQLHNILIKYIEKDKRKTNKFFIENFEINTGFFGKILITSTKIFFKDVAIILNNILHININFNKSEANSYIGKVNVSSFNYNKLSDSLDFIPKFKNIKNEALNNISIDFIFNGDRNHVSIKGIDINNKNIKASGEVNIDGFSPLLIKDTILLNKFDIGDIIDLDGYKLLVNSTIIKGAINVNDSLTVKQSIKSNELMLKGINIQEIINKFDEILSPTKNINHIVSSAYLSTLVDALQSYIRAIRSEKKINLEKVSNFDTFETNLIYNGNVLTNKDIIFYGKQLISNGNGYVNFNNNQLSYTLNTKLHSDNNKSILEDIIFRTYITGTTDNRKIDTDWPFVLKQIIQYFSKNGLYEVNRAIQTETKKSIEQVKEKAQNYINNLLK